MTGCEDTLLWKKRKNQDDFYFFTAGGKTNCRNLTFIIAQIPPAGKFSTLFLCGKIRELTQKLFSVRTHIFLPFMGAQTMGRVWRVRDRVWRVESEEWSFPLTAVTVTFLRKDRENVKVRGGSPREYNKSVPAGQTAINGNCFSAR